MKQQIGMKTIMKPQVLEIINKINSNKKLIINFQIVSMDMTMTHNGTREQ